MVKNGHQYDCSTVAETICAIEHLGLIENLPHKEEDSFFVRVAQKALASVTEGDTYDDAHSSHIANVDSSCQANSVEEHTPYEELLALRCTIFDLQRVMQTFNGSSDVDKINKIEKLRKENEFLKN